MKSFSNKIFIFLVTLLIFIFAAYTSINLLAPSSISYKIKVEKINALLLVANITIMLAWIILGPVFGGIFLVGNLLLILLIIVGSSIKSVYVYFLLAFGVSYLMHYFYSKYIETRGAKELKLEDSIEKKNTILNQHNKQSQTSKALDKKMHRYSALKEITETLSSTLILDELKKYTVDKTINLIGKSDVCLLYVIDEIQLELSLIASKSTQDNMHIKEKKGDIFDQWVFRQRQPLNITDISKDFRFNAEDIESLGRDFKSILSAPMIAENRVIGILRLDSQKTDAYNPDDLRLLDIMTDLSAVSLENAILYKRIEELAIKDDLTGLYIRRYFEQRFAEEFDNAIKYEQPLNLLMLDIDHFKQYNDTYGHVAGDIVLKHVAEIMSDSIGPDDLIARFGGEEFIILLLGIDKDSAIKKANDIRKQIKDHTIMLRRKKTGVTASIGVANYPSDSKLKKELIHQADVNLYKAKTQGRDQVCYS